jgi:hypothetical protein
MWRWRGIRNYASASNCVRPEHESMIPGVCPTLSALDRPATLATSWPNVEYTEKVLGLERTADGSWLALA